MGRVPINTGTALFYFRKSGILQPLIHALKYRSKKEVGVFLGELLGRELAEQPHYQTIDYIIPVPLHASKKRLRGYNQSEMFGAGIARSLGKPQLTDSLLRTKKNTIADPDREI